MEYLLSADWHISANKPRIRKDDTVTVQYEKIKWICNLANSLNVPLIVAGDITDKPTLPIVWLNYYIYLLKTVRKGVYVVFGQHDIFYHNPDLKKTALGLLLAAGAVKFVSELDGWDSVGWEETVPQMNKRLCIHHPITPLEPPFFMKEAISAKEFLQIFDYKVVVSGDYHVPHITRSDKGQILINPGPILRSSKDKMDYAPTVVYLNDATMETETFAVPIDGDVFDLTVADKDDIISYREDIRELANHIKFDATGKKYSEVLDYVVKEDNPSKEVKTLISEIMETVYECNTRA